MLDKGAFDFSLGKTVDAFDRREAQGVRGEVHRGEAEHDWFSEEGEDKRGIAVELVDPGEGEAELCLNENRSASGDKDEVGNMKTPTSVSEPELGVESPVVSFCKAEKPFTHFPLIPEPLPGGRVLRPWEGVWQAGRPRHQKFPAVRE